MNTKEYLKNLNQIIRENRVSIVEISKHLNKNRNTISSYLTGETEIPLPIFLRLCEFLKADPCEVLLGENRDEGKLLVRISELEHTNKILSAAMKDKDALNDELQKRLRYLQDFYDNFSAFVYGNLKK